MSRARGGYSMVEVLVSSVLVAVVAGGTLMAFIAASKMTNRDNSLAVAEANGYAQETTEQFRNLVGEDATWSTWLASKVGPTWHSGIETQLPTPATGGTESILASGARRCYRVTSQDCDGDATPGDCYAVDVQVCWNDMTGCSCP